MRLNLLLSFLLLIPTLVVHAAEPAPPAAPDGWDRVLGAVGLTKQTTRFDLLDMGNYGGGEFVLPYFTAMHGDPMRIPFYSRVMRKAALTAAPSAGKLVMLGSDRINEGIRRTLIDDPIKRYTTRAAEPGALVAAISAIHQTAGKPLSKKDLGRLTDAAKVVPADIAPQAAMLLLVESRALVWRNRALRDCGDAAFQQQMFNELVGADEDDERGFDIDLDRLQHRIDLKLLMVGGIDLALAVDQAAAALAKRTGTEQFTFDWDTPLGRIALHGAQHDSYAGDKAYLLTLDTGGNDVYFQGGATYSAAHPVSVLLDLAGDDRYLEKPELDTTAVAAYADRKKPNAHPVCGVGVLGYGMVLDAAGNDFYRGLSTTQGSGWDPLESTCRHASLSIL